MKEEDHVERLFASARRAEEGTAPSSVPSGFAESVLRQHRNRVQENKAFLRTSILSVATALIILGTVLGIDIETNGMSGSDDQEQTVEMAYSLWDPAGN
jgi:hypothetical protein